jgi:predicted nuclease of restriction endonuclease-like (RecB) superfamily
MKRRIHHARARALLAVNTELVMLYWELGREIVQQQQQEPWGAQVIARLAAELRAEFPDMTGLSRRNMQYMRTFANVYPDSTIVHSLLATIPWRHNVALVEKLTTLEERIWYATQVKAYGWTRDVLVVHITQQLYHRQGSAHTSFARTLSPSLADVAQQLTRDPFVFELPGWTATSRRTERTLERALMKRIRDLLLSLGARLAFLGNQYRLTFDERDYYADMLFYEAQIHAYLVVELKDDEFKPEYLGKLNFYVELVDTLLRDPVVDAPTIGLLICRAKRATTVELALRTTSKPVAVSSYVLAAQHMFVKKLQQELPKLLDLTDEKESVVRAGE